MIWKTTTAHACCSWAVYTPRTMLDRKPTPVRQSIGCVPAPARCGGSRLPSARSRGAGQDRRFARAVRRRPLVQFRLWPRPNRRDRSRLWRSPHPQCAAIEMAPPLKTMYVTLCRRHKARFWQHNRPIAEMSRIRFQCSSLTRVRGLVLSPRGGNGGFLQIIVSRRALVTPSASIKSDACGADRRSDPTPKHSSIRDG